MDCQRLFGWFGGLLFFLGVSASWVSAQTNKSGVAPNVLILPQGPGSLGGVGENVQANLNMGLMSYDIKVDIPAGRGEATPTVTLTYSSSAGSSVMGIGWELNAGGSIERLTVRGLPTYTNTDLFYANGELIRIPNTSIYRSRYESRFVRYRWIQKETSDQRGYWIAEYPDGGKGYFGANPEGVLDLDAHIYGLKGSFRWYLTTYVDRNGNRIEYTYSKEGAQSYLDTVRWVLDQNNQALYTMRFQYENRPDPISDGKPGFDLPTTRRLKGIEITSSGQRFRSYHFQFEDATGLSRLTKVTKYGRDPNLPYPIAFSMKYSDSTFSQGNSRLVTMPTSTGIDFKSGQADFLDVNGDGLPDIINTSGNTHLFHLNQLKLKDGLQQDTHDFPQYSVVSDKSGAGGKLNNPSVQLLDYNGDGFTDMIDAVNKKIYINRGNGQWEPQSRILDAFPVDGTDPNMRFFDYNGDKAIDVISSDGNTTTYWISDGKGKWTAKIGQTNIGRGFAKDRLRLIDINGDGLMDIVYITKDAMQYRKYLGHGEWTDWIDITVPQINRYELGTEAQFSDINGDGLADMVAFLGNKIVYFVNKNGVTFEEGKELQTFSGQDIPDSSQNSIRIADINGNGSRDIVWINSSGKVTYLELFNKRPNLLTEISNGIGQRINVVYGSSVYFYLRDQSCQKGQDKACAGAWKNKLPMAFPVVTQISTWASRTLMPQSQAQPTPEERPQIQSIYYHDGFYDGEEKQFRGFRHVETLYDGDTSMEARKDEIKYDVGDADPYLHGRLLENILSDGSNKIFSRSLFQWGDCPVALGPFDGKTFTPPLRHICLLSQEKEIIEGKESEKRTLRMEYTYDGYGNQINNDNLGDKDRTGDEHFIQTTYITPKDPNNEKHLWLLRYPQRQAHCAQKNGPCAALEYFYDGPAFVGLPTGQITHGNQTRLRARIETGKEDFIEPIKNEFDSYGNIVATKTATDLQRDFQWDDIYHRFSTQEVIRLKEGALTFKTQWDYALSAIVQSEDPNGQISRYTYDGFGRLTATSQAGDPEGKPSVAYTYKLQAPISQIVTESRSKQGGEVDRKQIQCFDGLGRKLSILSQIRPDRFLVFGHLEYNREGLRARRWNEYESDAECRFIPAQQTAETGFFYDGLRRLLKTTFPDGREARIAYEPLKRIESDEEDTKPDSPHANTPTTYILDGLERIVEEIRTLKQGDLTQTRFAYDLTNIQGRSQMTLVTFANGSQKRQEYDLLGNLRKITDPDRKTILYTYTPDNQIASITDARSVKVVFSYDGLQRIRTREQDGKPETRVTYYYDQPQSDFPEATFLKGRLAQIHFPQGRYLYQYDARGNTIQSRHLVWGHRFDFKRSYNNTNQLQTLTLPDGRIIPYQRDDAGRLLAIGEKVKDITYHPEGIPQTWTHANGLQTTVSLNTRRRIQRIDVGGGKAFTLDYTLDGYANPTEVKETHGTEQWTQRYTYDSLYRLTRASLANEKEILTYTQDGLHNLLTKTSSLSTQSSAHAGEYTYDKTKAHAAEKIGASTLRYDEAGHLLQRDDLQFSWDHLGRCESASRNQQPQYQAWFDHTTRRIGKWENNLHTFYINRFYEIREGALVYYTFLQEDRLSATWSVKGVEQFFDDLAPATGDTALTPKSDGQITAADAWLYHASRNKILNLPLKQRPQSIDLTRDMLMSSIQRLLLGEKQEITYAYHHDHLGNVRAISDEKGEIIQRKHYYPYGALRAQSGDLGIFGYGFQGAEWDTSTQVNVFLKRAADPRLGRWLSPDPMFQVARTVRDEFNSYANVLNNPIRNRDFEGTDSSPVTDATISNTGARDAADKSSMDYGTAIGLGAAFGVALGIMGAVAYAKSTSGSLAIRRNTVGRRQDASVNRNRSAGIAGTVLGGVSGSVAGAAVGSTIANEVKDPALSTALAIGTTFVLGAAGLAGGLLAGAKIDRSRTQSTVRQRQQSITRANVQTRSIRRSVIARRIQRQRQR